MIKLLKKRYVSEDNEQDDINIYSKQVRESMLEDDELSPMEEAFMEGYEGSTD